MTFIDDVTAALAEDEILAALMTGGIYSGSEISEVSRQNTPGAFDANMEVQPCMLVVEQTEYKYGPYRRSMQTTIGVYFYQTFGYGTIEQGMDRTFDLLHEAKIGEGTWEIHFLNSVKNQRDTALDCSLQTMRFTAARMRPEYEAAGSGS